MELDEDIQRLWIEEALLRDAELDSGAASSRDAEDVFRDARARLLKRSSCMSNPNGDLHDKS
ncbi:MAG TPA: hypothetical protein VJ751_13465 [Pyrinomonadaceae bacterium]|jgi:hypothetical protein|nr:hypothetical protein [Pyrinomonadaceae bacterium]